MKKLLSALVVIALIGSIALFAIGCSESDPTPDNVTAASYVVIDINPSVELTVSEEGIVLSANAVNDDAAVLLAKVEVVGKTLEEASEVLAEKSIELGFISEGNNTEISITVCGTTLEIETEIYEKIKGKFQAKVKETCHFNLGVERDVLLSLKTELETLKAENPDNEAIQNLNIARYRMIVSAMEKDSTLTLEAALAKSTQELISIIKTGTLKHVGKKLEKLHSEAEQEYQKLYDSAYGKIDNVLVKAKSAAIVALRAIEHQLEMLEEFDLEQYTSVTLTEEQVRTVASMLGLTEAEIEEFVTKCCGLDGTFTERNIECAINRLYRNLPAAEREAFEEKYEAAEEYMEELEENITIPEKYVAQLTTLVGQLKTILENTTITLPTGTVTYEEFEEFVEDIEEMVEDKIEALEKELKALIHELGLDETLKNEIKKAEALIKEAEERYEAEFEKCEDELERIEEEHINNWMNQHGNKKP